MPIDCINVKSISSNGTGTLSFHTGLSGSLAERVRITPQGRMGIGTQNPTSPLDVIGNITSSNYVTAVGLWAGSSTAIGNPEVTIQTNSTTWRIVNNGTGTSLPGALEFRNQTVSRFVMDNLGRVRMGIGAAWPAATLDIAGDQSVVNSLLIDIAFSNYATLVTEKRIAILQCLTGAGANSGVLAFQTANIGVLAERMRIDSQGRVGIGTQTPAYKLEVNGDVNIVGKLYINGIAIT